MKLELVKNIIALAIVAGITWGVTDYLKDQQIQVITESKQTQLDSLSTRIENGRRTREALLDSLDNLDGKFREYVEETGDEIANYTSIIGRLRVHEDRLRDSLAQKNQLISALTILNQDSTSNQVFKDTTITASKTWSDSLFMTTGIVRFDSDSLKVDSDLAQLRDIRLDIVTTMSEDRTRLNTYVRSPDFDSLRASSYTELEPTQKRPPWGWVAAGALVIYELIFN